VSHQSWIIVVIFALSASSCQLFTDFDKSKIQDSARQDGSTAINARDGGNKDSGPLSGCKLADGGACKTKCDNGVIESGETCDPMTSCKASCDDGTACTIDTMSGKAETCDVVCEHETITQCRNGDGCCPSACSYLHDSDCTTTCGNGMVEPGETCDLTTLCPSNCSDGNSCTIDTMTGSVDNCNIACSYQLITRCQNQDGCCPVGCTGNDDSDCTTTCDNGSVEPGETCDPPSSCPTSCNDGNACTIDTLTGSATNCNVSCSVQTITQCESADGCCPAGCTAINDRDCSSSCGNGQSEPGETCDPPSSCPASCNDGNACTIDTLTGSAANCNAACGHQAISQCQSGDGCCPAGCNANSDTDCSASCGNNIVESGETCDLPASCPVSCSDGNSCTIDAMTGSAANCNVACGHQEITACTHDDGCCPSGCNIDKDNDCSASCGDGAVTSPETCDPPASCLISCGDGNACTVDTMTGSAANCNVACSSQAITSCTSGDGCCPSGCTIANDNDCSASCGDGVVTSPETCDPSTSCPASCSDGNSCTIDTVTGSAINCNVACSHQVITTCTSGDGCCPLGCNALSDNDCSPYCGDGVVTSPETCDPPNSCAANCSDGNACTIDEMTGSAANCNVACTSHAITSCTNGDGCCPSGCTRTNDNDCSSTCDDGVITSPETCDPRASCPTSCDDANACTIDNMTGSSANCDVACTQQEITACANGDGCCPAGCNLNIDNDCTATCGNSEIELGETCNPSSTCPTNCDDNNACTIDILTGSSANCNAICGHQKITQCGVTDGCCPPGCKSKKDLDSDCTKRE
jgi:hypothetical protein